MKFKRITLLLTLGALSLWGCASHSDYDLTDGVNTEVTLFSDEVVVPIGSIGPFTVKNLLDSSIGQLLTSILKEGSDGLFYIEEEKNICSVDAYELAWRHGDSKEPFTWNPGTMSTNVGSTSLLTMVGLSLANQQLIIQATNPYDQPITFHTEANASTIDQSYSQSIPLPDFSLRDSYKTTIAQFEIPSTVGQSIYTVSLKDLSVDIPAEPGIYSPSQPNLSFSFKYKTNVALGDKLSFPFDIPSVKLSVELKKYQIHKCQLVLDVQNTLPLSVAVNSIQVLTPSGKEGEDPVVAENVSVTSGFTLAGGSLETPVTSPLNLVIEAKDGVVPDIAGLKVNVTLQSTPGLGNVPLSSKQGVFIKSSYVRLNGGITLFGHEEN